MNRNPTITEMLETLLRFEFDVHIRGGYGTMVVVHWLTQDEDNGNWGNESATYKGHDNELQKLITQAYNTHIPRQFRRSTIKEILQSAQAEVNSWPLWKQRLARNQSFTSELKLKVTPDDAE